MHHSYDAVMLIGMRINLLGTTGMPKCYLFILQSVRFTVKCYACPAAWSLAMVRDIAKQKGFCLFDWDGAQHLKQKSLLRKQNSLLHIIAKLVLLYTCQSRLAMAPRGECV